MKYIIFILFALTSSYTSAEALNPPLEVKTQNCATNCVITTKIGSQWVVVVKDISGEIIKLVSLDLNKKAKLADNLGTKSRASIMGGGGSTSQTTETYFTATEVVVVTTTIYMNAHGQIVNVDVNVVRFPKFIE